MLKRFFFFSFFIFLTCASPVLGQKAEVEDLFYEDFQSKNWLDRVGSIDSLKKTAWVLIKRGKKNREPLDIVKGQILAVAALHAEGKSDTTIILLDQAESHISQHPDRYFTRENGSIQFYRALVYKLDATSLKIVYAQHASTIFSRTGDKLNESLAQALIGNIELLRENYPSALQHYLDARKLNLTLENPSKQFDPGLELNIANVYLWMGQFKNALTTSREAIRILTQKGEPAFPNAYLILASAHKSLGNHDSAIFYFDKGISVSKSHDAMVTGMYFLALFYHDNEEFEKSNAIVRKAMKITSDAELDISSNILLARNFIQLGKYDSAELRIRNLMRNPLVKKHSGELLELNIVMADLFRNERRKDSLIKYLDRIDSLKNKIHSVENQRKLSSIYAEMETLASQQQIKFLEQQKQASETERKRLTIISILGGVVAVLVIVVIVLTQRNRHKRQQLLQHKLEHELKEKEKSLHEQALKMIYMNNSMTEIEERLKKVKPDPTNNSNDIQSVLSGIQLNRSLEKEWDNFETYFGTVHIGFYEKFNAMYPNLTIMERRLAGLVKMNMTNSEIAGILNIETASVKTAKYRLKKKIGGTEEQDLHQLLQAIAQ